MNNNQKWIIGLIAGVVLICLCAGAACVALGGAAMIFNRQSNQEYPPVVIETQAGPDMQLPGDGPTEPPLDTQPTPDIAQDGTTQPGSPTAVAKTASKEAQETLGTLEKMVVPINDPRDMAGRLLGIKDIPATMTPPQEPLKVGDNQTFWASNVETNQNFQVKAQLRYITDHLYFWVQEGVNFDEQALQQLCDTFEKKIYPTDRAFFGSEWSPGIDGDPHLYVLYARGLGNGIAGYFSSADELPPQAHQYSNAHEMFLMSADNVRLDDPYIYGTMAHEFQNKIHWYRDRNEESWMNEGFSVVAEFLNGYDIGGFDALYVTNPDIQLTDWPSPPDSTPHYGQSFLFLNYLLNRLGEKATQALVATEDNGMDSIDKALAALKQTDPQTGKALTADDLFADWAVAAFLNQPKIADGRYAYKNYPTAPKPDATETVTDCNANPHKATVHQYGVDYIQINCSGSYTLRFKGAPEVGVLPVNAHSGNYAFWSNKGDESDMILTRAFDFSQVQGPITLQYATWYDLETDYDYAYVEVSEDGSSWKILNTPSGRDKAKDPSGNSYGWGYNGQSGDWITEKVDLSAYAGKKVQVRFEYVTDAAVNNNGLLVDDIQIPEIKYSEDFEKDNGGWDGAGFVRIQNRLPQTFRVSLIQQGQTVSVQSVVLDNTGAATVPLRLGGDIRGAVLVVSGVTRFTNQEASYEYSFQK